MLHVTGYVTLRLALSLGNGMGAGMIRQLRLRRTTAAGVLTGVLALAQPPEGAISVRVLDSAGRPLAGATVTAQDALQTIEISRATNTSGEAYIGALTPGMWTFSAAHPGYTTTTRSAVPVSVGSRQELTFVLSSATPQLSSDASGLLANLPPPPVLRAETVASSVSVVVDENQIVNLPLISRNLYSLFVLQPGVTSAGANPRRGLTFSVHGQRVSASNYLLDGVDNNSSRTSGPVAVSSLEGAHELRMVNSSFSADSGRATGFVAHVSTRRGAAGPHGAAFGYFGDDALNATPSATKALNEPKQPFRQLQAGFSAGGPLLSSRTFGSTTIETSRLRYGSLGQFRLPTPQFISNLPELHPLRPLFASTPPLPVEPSQVDPRYGDWVGSITGRINSVFTTTRIDRLLGDARDRLQFRYTMAVTEQQLPTDFRGYHDLWPSDRMAAHNSMVGWTRTWTAGPINDLRLGWTRERSFLSRPYNDRPALSVLARPVQLPAVTTRLMEENDNNNIVQLVDNLTLRRGRSTLLLGTELRRYISNGQNAGIESRAHSARSIPVRGIYGFASLAEVAASRVTFISLGVERFAPELRLADFSRQYRSTDAAAFIQHDLKLTRRVSLSTGLRWEFFGVMHDKQPATDYNFYAGAGATPGERLANGVLRSTADNAGDLKNRIYRPRYLNFAPSFGLAWDPFGRGRTVVRAGYAIAQDRIFDAARDVRTNRALQANCIGNSCPGLVLPVAAALPLIVPDFVPPWMVIVDENLRTPYAQNWYVGIQQGLTETLAVELAHSGSAGRKLISRDFVNREGPPHSATVNDIFITNQASSTYLGLEFSIRKRLSASLQFQGAYTWSHAIDNQSDILEGTRVGRELQETVVGTFTRALDPMVDRASANFDQRHNLIFSGIWNLPAVQGRLRLPLSGWTASAIAGYHSGFPLTVVGNRGLEGGYLFNRPDLVRPLSTTHAGVPGGVRWLDRNDFQIVRNRVGNLGRNAVAGPSSWSCDFALIRTLPVFRERVRAQFRFEAYNLFNHANLGLPATNLSAPDFGVAYAGRSRSYYSRFGELPLDSPARRLQLALRFHF
ncbi:MAG TPA: carboxypeptidase-like regulatory domain-containing protein [Bryobacteraceae bacterium]|nr:carboxypeptidase-like regulatory domain-containing protein [Bryobacteraceae bacterium]